MTMVAPLAMTPLNNPAKEYLFMAFLRKKEEKTMTKLVLYFHL